MSDAELIAQCIELALPFLVGPDGASDLVGIHEERAVVGTPQRDGYKAVYIPAANPQVEVPEAALVCQLNPDPANEPLSYAAVTAYGSAELDDFLNGIGETWQEYTE